MGEVREHSPGGRMGGHLWRESWGVMKHAVGIW